MKTIAFTAALLFLFSCTDKTGQAPKKTTVKILAKATRSWNGTPLPAYPKGRPEVSILEITIPGKTSLPWHTHPVINAGVMLKGRLTVITKKGRVLKLKAGDSIVEVVDTWHMGKNEHKEPVKIIVFYAGVKGRAVTKKRNKR